MMLDDDVDDDDDDSNDVRCYSVMMMLPEHDDGDVLMSVDCLMMLLT